MKTRILFPSLALLALGMVYPSRGDAIDSFLQNVLFTAGGQGVSNAIVQLDGRLASGKLGVIDRARLTALRVDLMTRDKLHLESDEDRTVVPAAFELARVAIFDPPEVPAAMKMETFSLLDGRRVRKRSPSEPDEAFLVYARRFLADPDFTSDPRRLYDCRMLLGDLHAKRHCQDQALASYLAAAEAATGPSEKAEALLRGAFAARVYRDMRTSSALLDQIAALEGAPFAVRKRALLIRGENAIYPVEHGWRPSREAVAEARGYVEKALADHSPLVGTDEATQVLLTLIRATAGAGDAKEAVKMAHGLLEGNSRIESHLRADILVFLADTYHAMGDYRNAIKHYELAMPSSYIGKYHLNLRIATSARAGGDFFRAMQAYSEAIKICNPIENRDEIAHLTTLVSQMNKIVRKGASAFDSEAIFTDTNEEISDLALDEE